MRQYYEELWQNSCQCQDHALIFFLISRAVADNSTHLLARII